MKRRLKISFTVLWYLRIPTVTYTKLWMLYLKYRVAETFIHVKSLTTAHPSDTKRHVTYFYKICHTMNISWLANCWKGSFKTCELYTKVEYQLFAASWRSRWELSCGCCTWWWCFPGSCSSHSCPTNCTCGSTTSNTQHNAKIFKMSSFFSQRSSV